MIALNLALMAVAIFAAVAPLAWACRAARAQDSRSAI